MAAQHVRLLIGLDGGGTKTAGAVALWQPDGTVGQKLGTATVESTNPHKVGWNTAKVRLAEIVQKLLHVPGVTSLSTGSKSDLPQLAGVCLAAAGVDRPQEQREFTAAMEALAPGASIEVVNDAVGALAGAFGALKGMVLISGTGSIALAGTGKLETLKRCGGWGHLLDDFGSGFRLGLNAMTMLCRVDDGRESASMLTELIHHQLGIKTTRDLMSFVYGGPGKDGKEHPPASPAEIAALTRSIFLAYDRGDVLATKLVDTEAEALVDLVLALYHRIDWPKGETLPLALFGGNLTHVPKYRARVVARLDARRDFPLKVVEPAGDAADGALLLACQAANRTAMMMTR